MSQKDILSEILKDTAYDLSIFEDNETKILNGQVFFKEIRGQKKPHVRCIIRERDILLKPEEIVRQLYVSKLIKEYGYPKQRMRLEHPVQFGRETKYADIVVFDKDRPTAVYIIVELKKPKLVEGKNQLRSSSISSITFFRVILPLHSLSSMIRSLSVAGDAKTRKNG